MTMSSRPLRLLAGVAVLRRGGKRPMGPTPRAVRAPNEAADGVASGPMAPSASRERAASGAASAPTTALPSSSLAPAARPDREPSPSPRSSRTLLDLSDSAAAHGSKTTLELLRGIAVFRACQIPFLVRHAGTLLEGSARILGGAITDGLVRHTFFRHFCAGEDGEDVRPVIDRLGRHGIGPILDYAAESDGGGEGEGDATSDGADGIVTRPPFNQPARVYDYRSEEDCDKHVEVFKSCIRSVRDVAPTHGFAALKVTALGNPELLERMSTMVVEVKNLFSKFDREGSGLIGREDFVRCYERYFHSDDERLARLIQSLDPNDTGMIDHISFSQMFTPCRLPEFTLKCKDVGPLALATPSNDEIMLMKAMSERLNTLAEEAVRCRTKLLIDAEHRKYQPAIDGLVLELQRRYNAKDRTGRPVVFNTYQCYLKDAAERIAADLERADRFSFHFAAKLVRGAYMVHERERARSMGVPSPVHDNAEDTHRCYDEAVGLLLRRREVVIATHNGGSVGRAVGLMDELGLRPGDGGVHFAQLYGMSDNLTFALGGRGYNAFKYLPYGKVREVVPYLVRRAQENGDMLGNAGSEVDLLQEELWKRFYFP